MTCNNCGKEADELYGIAFTGRFSCGACFGFFNCTYVGGETWLQKAWREDCLRRMRTK